MAWKVTTAPASEPVTLAEIKDHLRITDDDGVESDYLESLITAAREYCEDYQSRAYITQTITLTIDRFPNFFELPQAPFQEVDSIKYIDTNGDQQDLADTVYDEDNESEPGRVVLAYGQSWPAIRGDINSVEVIYKAGYGGAATNVPMKIRQAIKLIVGHLYENRETSSVLTIKEVPMAAKSLLSMNKVY